MFLGIETSCDETAAAVVTREGSVLSNEIYSQIEEHKKFGGVVPELASRCHVQVLPSIVDRAVRDAGISWTDLEGIAVTRGPGLASALLTGIAYARGLAMRLKIPLYGVNHLVGHIQSVSLEKKGPARELSFPHLMLLVSGGHTCLLRRDSLTDWTVLGQTLDDAAGEALDKGARLMGLGYPGGPAIETTGADGDPSAIDFPRGNPKPGTGGYALPFTYSGLKTALLYHLKKHPEDAAVNRVAGTAASFQEAVVDALVRKVSRALDMESVGMIGCAGGVARNKRLREKLGALGAKRGVEVRFAEPAYCADNAAMIAAAAIECYVSHHPAGTTVDVKPGLSLVEPLLRQV